MIVTRFAPLKIRRRSHWYHVVFLLQAFVLVMGSSVVLVPAATAQTHFSTCADGTSNIFNATIIVPETSTPTINGAALAPGSEMAVYSESTPGFCAGTVTWSRENVTITVWGDDTNTEDVLEGLVEGERMLFRVWDASTRTEYRDDAVTVTFESEPGFATNNRYYNDAIYVVADLSVTASSPPPPPSSGSAIGEAGNVSVKQTSSDQWHTVTLKQAYTNPVVVLGPPSYEGSHPLTTRVRKVSANSFEFQLDEWDYLDGEHTQETVSYFVVEAGTHQLADGSTLEAGFLELNHNWKNASFSSSFKTKPVVLTQTSSHNGGQAVTTRMKDVTSSGFSVRLQEEDGGDGQHTMEQVGYIAVKPTTIASGHKLEAGHTGDQVTHAWHAMNFKQSYGSSVAFLAAMQTFDGGNAATVRYTDLSESQASVMVEEEQSFNEEMNHTTEVVGYLAIQSGTLEGTSSAAHASLAAKVSAEEASEVQLAGEVPGQYVLEGNYPNPFNPETTIRYALPEAGHVQLTVFDALGRRVAVLVDARQGAGRYEARFDARTLPSGVYFYRLEAESFVQMKKMLLVK